MPPARVRSVIAATFAVYLVGVARLTLWPEAFGSGTEDFVQAAIAWVRDHGLPITYAVVEAAANIALFVPFGVLAGFLVSRRRWWAVLAAGFATTVAIETSQLLFLPTRFASIQDVVVNTLGTGLGLMVLALALRTRGTGTAATPSRAEEDLRAQGQVPVGDTGDADLGVGGVKDVGPVTR